jgi:integrase
MSTDTIVISVHQATLTPKGGGIGPAELVDLFLKEPANAKHLGAELHAWLTRLGLFPPRMVDFTPRDIGELPRSMQDAVRDLVRWGVRQGFIDFDPFATTTGLFLSEICDAFFLWAGRWVKAKTVKWYHEIVDRFLARWPRLTVEALKPFHVTRFLDHSFEPAQRATRRQALARINRPINWAVEQGLIDFNPLGKKLKLGKMPRRKKILSHEERDILKSNASDCFQDFLLALSESGARPGEVMRVAAADVDLRNGTWTLDEHKSDKHTDEPRVIYLSPPLLELTRRLCVKHPEGPIFRNTRGLPWTVNATGRQMRRLRRRMKLDEKIVCYASRHTYATEALERGIPPATVAELLGHQDLTMLSEHYAHLGEKKDHLRNAAASAVKPPADPGRREGLRLFQQDA